MARVPAVRPQGSRLASNDQRVLSSDGGADEEDSEDLDALRKGGGKNGKGRNRGEDNPACAICLRKGHLKDKCFANPESATYKGDEYRQRTLEVAGRTRRLWWLVVGLPGS